MQSVRESPTRTAGDAEPSPWPGAEQPLAATAFPLRSLQRLRPARPPLQRASLTTIGKLICQVAQKETGAQGGLASRQPRYYFPVETAKTFDVFTDKS